jgi:AcrR family transcriptional regulator
MARSYVSDVRAARSRRSRASVLAAAQDMFCTEGWVATTMARVAERSGVARQTVYLMFVTKLALLDACIDAALSEGQGVPVRELPDYQAMGQGDFAERLAAGARWLAAAHQRSARIQRVLDEAAVTDPAAAARLADREDARWREVRWAMSLVLDTDRPDDTVVDLVWTLGSRDVWLKLVGQRGWTPQDWIAWFTTAVGPVRK